MEFSKEQVVFLEIINLLKNSNRKIPNTDIKKVAGVGSTFINNLKRKGYGKITDEMISRLKAAYPDILGFEEREAIKNESTELKEIITHLNKENIMKSKQIEAALAKIKELEEQIQKHKSENAIRYKLIEEKEKKEKK